MLYNLLIDWKDHTVDITEPLTVQEVKDYLRLEGFIDNSQSLSSNFNDDNALIGDLIISARERLEEYTGLSFVPKTLEVELTNLCGDFEIPYGPVNSIVYLKDNEDTSITDYELSLNKRLLKTPKLTNMTLKYEAGYEVLPLGLKDAMYKEVAYRYINRGDENKEGLSKEAMVLAAKYKTANWLG